MICLTGCDKGGKRKHIVEFKSILDSLFSSLELILIVLITLKLELLSGISNAHKNSPSKAIIILQIPL